MPIIGLIVGVVIGVFIGPAYFQALVNYLSQSIVSAMLPPFVDTAVIATWDFLMAPVTLGIAVIVLIHVVLVAVAYAVAALTTNTAGAGQVNVAPSLAEEFALGFLCGLNAPINFCMLFAVVPILTAAALSTSVLSGPTGILMGILLLPFVVLVINILAGVRMTYNSVGISNSPVYHAFVGWMGLFQLFPMAWPGTLVFVIQLVLELIVQIFIALFGGRWTMFPWIEFRTGTFVVQGAPIADAIMGALGSQAYSYGNFCFVYGPYARRSPTVLPGETDATPLTALGAVMHESGHTILINLLGDVFGIMNFIDQTVFGRRDKAYAEALAEGMVRESVRPWHGMLAITLSSNIPPAETAKAPESRVIPSAVALGDSVTLNGVGVEDDDNYPIGLMDPQTSDVSVLWYLSERPEGSQAAPAEPNNMATTFVADIAGSYALRYAVTDGLEGGDMQVNTLNGDTEETVVAVLLVPGGPYTGQVDTPVPLDASATSAGPEFYLPSADTGGDMEGDEMDVAWSVITAPPGAGGVTPITSFSDDGSDVADFQADTAGTYVLEFAVSPNGPDSAVAAQVTVEVTP